MSPQTETDREELFFYAGNLALVYPCVALLGGTAGLFSRSSVAFYITSVLIKTLG